MATRTLTGAAGATALVVPLPTVWTIPADGCRNHIYEGFRTISTSCVPPQFDGVWHDGGYYSPGVCPASHTLGCTVTDVEGWADAGGAGRTVAPGESAYFCVPSNYKCHDLAYATTSGGTAAPTSRDSLPYYLPAIQIRWRAADLPALQPAPTADLPTSGSGAPGASGGAAPGAGGEAGAGAGGNAGTGAGSNVGTGAGGGLAAPALVGISVAATVAVIAAASCLIFLLRRRRRRRRPTEARELPPDPAALPTPPLGELDSKALLEADYAAAVSERKPSPSHEVIELAGHDADVVHGLKNLAELPGARDSR